MSIVMYAYCMLLLCTLSGCPYSTGDGASPMQGGEVLPPVDHRFKGPPAAKAG